MLPFEYHHESGIDESGRGCLFGPVYAAAVILPSNVLEIEDVGLIRDSKKLSAKKREKAFEFIQKNALAYAIASCTNEEIDQSNILQQTMNAMHKAIKKLSIKPVHILVDGNYFQSYEDVPHKCVIKGDATYMNIAAASILAKVSRDRHIHDILKTNPVLDEQYGLSSNLGYGTKRHMDGIITHGVTKYHRISFKPCQFQKKNVMGE